MENTTIAPTFEIHVQFSWKYPGKPIKNIVKDGYIQSINTEDKLIAEEFINTFISNYEIGICEVTDMKILQIKRVFTFDEWVEKYKPIRNHIEESSTFEGYAFETYGEEFDFVCNQSPDKIWTLRNLGHKEVITFGLGWVDRDFYFVTEKPCEKEDELKQIVVI